MNLSNCIDAFDVACRAANLSPTTVNWYHRLLVDYRTWTETQDAFSLTTARQFMAYLQSRQNSYLKHPKRYQTDKSLSPYTIRAYYRALRRFFRWLVAEGMLDADPLTRLAAPKLPRRIPRGIDLSDIQKILAVAETDRDRALIRILFDTGCRVSEITDLQMNDLRLSDGVALVKGKGNQERFVFLSPSTVEALQKYLGNRTNVSRVFLTTRGQDLGRGGIYQILKRLARRANVKKFNPHSWRHSFARYYLMQEGDLSSLSDLMGHKDIETTKIYAQFLLKDLKEKHAKHSPVTLL